jgi:2-amino-4-hydroxy-6-hydroxymethyldihydropteridine diphosphokinase
MDELGVNPSAGREHETHPATAAGEHPRRAFLSLGANLGDRAASLRGAREALAALPRTRLLAASPLYETAPQDREDQPDFLNQVVCVETALEPDVLLRHCQELEDRAARVRVVRFGPRTLDVDILLVEGVERDDPQLTLPHPRMWQRAFVLVPLADLWDLARDVTTVDVPALAATLRREQAVEPYPTG